MSGPQPANVGVLLEDQGGGAVVVFMCPACRSHHPVTVRTGPGTPPRPCWSWNGSLTAPTFTASLNVFAEGKARWGEQHPRCHSFITDGRIQFLGDCEHDLAGQTVALGPAEWD